MMPLCCAICVLGKCESQMAKNDAKSIGRVAASDFAFTPLAVANYLLTLAKQSSRHQMHQKDTVELAKRCCQCCPTALGLVFSDVCMKIRIFASLPDCCLDAKSAENWPLVTFDCKIPNKDQNKNVR